MAERQRHAGRLADGRRERARRRARALAQSRTPLARESGRRLQRRRQGRHSVAERQRHAGGLADGRRQRACDGTARCPIRARAGTRWRPAISTATARPTSCGRTTMGARGLADGRRQRAAPPDGALHNPGAGWHVKEALDFNGDGKADILWQHDDGPPAVWLMDSVNVASHRPGAFQSRRQLARDLTEHRNRVQDACVIAARRVAFLRVPARSARLYSDNVPARAGIRERPAGGQHVHAVHQPHAQASPLSFCQRMSALPSPLKSPASLMCHARTRPDWTAPGPVESMLDAVHQPHRGRAVGVLPQDVGLAVAVEIARRDLACQLSRDCRSAGRHRPR